MNRKEFIFKDLKDPMGLSLSELLTFKSSLPSDSKIINISLNQAFFLSAIVESSAFPTNAAGHPCPEEDFYFYSVLAAGQTPLTTVMSGFLQFAPNSQLSSLPKSIEIHTPGYYTYNINHTNKFITVVYQGTTAPSFTRDFVEVFHYEVPCHLEHSVSHRNPLKVPVNPPPAQNLNSHAAPFWGTVTPQTLSHSVCQHVWKTYIGLGFQDPFDYCDTCGVKK